MTDTLIEFIRDSISRSVEATNGAWHGNIILFSHGDGMALVADVPQDRKAAVVLVNGLRCNWGVVCVVGETLLDNTTKKRLARRGKKLAYIQVFRGLEKRIMTAAVDGNMVTEWREYELGSSLIGNPIAWN